MRSGIDSSFCLHIYEHNLFDDAKHNSTLIDFINRYNEIVLDTEKDLSPRIEFEIRKIIMADVYDPQKRSEIMRRVKPKKNKTTELRLIELLSIME